MKSKLLGEMNGLSIQDVSLAGDEVDNTVSFDRHILLGDHLDSLLSDESAKEGSCSREVGGWRASTLRNGVG